MLFFLRYVAMSKAAVNYGNGKIIAMIYSKIFCFLFLKEGNYKQTPQKAFGHDKKVKCTIQVNDKQMIII